MTRSEPDRGHSGQALAASRLGKRNERATHRLLSERAGVIVGNDGANTSAHLLGRSVVTLVPVTSNITHVYPFQTLLAAEDTGLDTDAKAHAEQVRSMAVERIGPVIGSVPIHLMDDLDNALRLRLGL